MTDQVGVKTFICIDCGADVVSIGTVHANDMDICAECTWLRAVEDDAEREKLRKFLKER